MAISVEKAKVSIDLTERFLRGAAVYDGELLHVRRDVVSLPNGREAAREYIRHPGAVAIIPLFEDGRILLERQYRYPLGREFIEIPAGKIDPGEAQLETARRELLEETGYAAEQWTRLGTIHVAISYTDEGIDIFLARGLILRETKRDEEEFLETFKLPFPQALEMVHDGRITDAKSVAGLFWLQAYLEK